MVKKVRPDSWRMLNCSYNSAFRNLALEEAMARCAVSMNFKPTVRFWVNPESVVLGRFQEMSSEIDRELAERKRIQIARRFTGGGTVYHDEGNLNFTIVTRREEQGSIMDMHATASSIIMDTLLRLGLEAEFLPPNSILVGGRKIAGASAALGNGFALWHSSIMVSTNLDILGLVLAPSKIAIATRFVHSRWRPVVNLREAIGRGVSVDEVKSRLIDSIQQKLRVKLEADEIRGDEETCLESLFRWKYSLSEWNRNGRYDASQIGFANQTTIAV